ncbi:OPT/YSL family transporter, partial [Pseudoduganella sp. RAF53_2]
PPLGVGLAIYLPSAVTSPVVVGAIAGWLFDRAMKNKKHGEAASRLGVLVMSGFIVGESLFNVALAGLIVLTNKGEPLAIATGLGESAGMIIATAVGGAMVVALYRWSAKSARAIEA